MLRAARSHAALVVETVMNKATKNDRNRIMIAGVQKHYGPNDTVLVAGVATPQPSVVATLQAPIDAGDKTAAAEATFHKAVADEAALVAAADTLFLALKTHFLDVYKKAPDTLKDYGLTPIVRRQPSAATKMAAAAKAKATRALRGTKGSRQKAAIVAPPMTAVAVPADESKAAPTPAPAATPSKA
jgi:hypothetical protein